MIEMVFIRKLTIYFALFLAHFECSWAASTYYVLPNDSLSTIALSHGNGPVYGNNGSLQKLLMLNPSISNPDHIRVGQAILVWDSNHANSKKRAIRFAASVPDSTSLPVEVQQMVNPPVSPDLIEATLPASTPLTLFRPFSFVGLRPSFYYSRLDVVNPSDGNTSFLISKPNTGVEISWNQVWSEKFQTYQSLGFRKEEFEQDASSQVQIRNNSVSLFDMSIGSRFDLPTSIFLKGSAALFQQVFYFEMQNPSGVTLTAVSVPRFNFGLGYRLLTIEPFFVETAIEASQTLEARTTNFATRQNTGYGASLSLSQLLPSFQMGYEFFYQKLNSNSDILNASQSTLGFRLNLVWKFEDRKL
ncbi:MAG: LysM peptidoglycan-binding domain-containing protein [Pseudobdellovibrionaceae bacterium]